MCEPTLLVCALAFPCLVCVCGPGVRLLSQCDSARLAAESVLCCHSARSAGCCAFVCVCVQSIWAPQCCSFVSSHAVCFLLLLPARCAEPGCNGCARAWRRLDLHAWTAGFPLVCKCERFVLVPPSCMIDWLLAACMTASHMRDVCTSAASGNPVTSYNCPASAVLQEFKFTLPQSSHSSLSLTHCHITVRRAAECGCCAACCAPSAPRAP